MKKIALLFAGQGAQIVGMGKDLAQQFPTAADLFRRADEILRRKLSDIAWNGPIEELTKTSNCQPALFVHGLACLSILRELAGNFPIGGAAGLSLGEMTAHAAAGTFDFENGLKLVQKRGEFMDEACATTIGGMAAMIGGLENDVRQLAADEDVDVANINALGQIVVSGELAKVEAPVEIRRTLQDQVTSTVRWVDCMERLVGLGCDLFIELGPGGVLAGLLKRTRKDVEVISVSDVESVRACSEKIRI